MLRTSRSLRALVPIVPLLALSGALLAADPASGPAATPAAPAARPAPKAKKLPPIFDPDALGTKAIEAGVEACKKTDRRPFVVFGTNDCDPCRTFNDALYDKVFFDAFIKQFVPILIDASPGGPNEQLLKNYGIDRAKGFPAAGIFELDQTPPEITRNGELAAVSRKGERAVQEWILARFKKDAPEEK